MKTSMVHKKWLNKKSTNINGEKNHKTDEVAAILHQYEYKLEQTILFYS